MTADTVSPPAPTPEQVQTDLRVLHAVRRQGEISQSFIADAIVELAALGWEPWVLSLLEPADAPSGGVPSGRVLRPVAPSLPRRAIGRALLRDERRRTIDWWRPAVRTARPALLHAHFGWTVARAATGRLGVPLLVSFHGSDVNAWPHASPERMALYRQLFAELDRATAVSRFIEGRLRGLGYEGPIDIVPPGVRLERFRFREPAPPRPDVGLLFVGRQVSCKGLDTLLEAIARLDGRLAVRLDVIGDGPLRETHEILARRLGIERRVTFHGALPHADVARALAAADVLVVPSRRSADGEEEGSPVAPKEALATGTALVATDVGGMAETVPPALRSELVAPNEPEALAHRILATVQERERWPARAREGRAWVEEEFDWARIARRVATIYAEMVSRADPPRRANKA